MPIKSVLLTAVFAAVMLDSVIAQELRPVPLKSTITRVQPMTGIVLWSDNFNALKYPDAITLEYRYCGYNEVANPQGEYDYSKIDRILDEIAKRNHQAVLRFYFCYVGKKNHCSGVHSISR